MKFFLVILIMICCSCKQDTSQQIASIGNNQSINREIIGKRISFLGNLYSVNNKLNRPEQISKPIILTTVGTDCAACVEKFMAWTSFDTKQLAGYEIIFVAMGPKTPLLTHYLEVDDKKHFTILLDTSGTFVSNNQIYSYYQRTLILDKNKQVIYVGDPTKNETVLNDLHYIAHEN